MSRRWYFSGSLIGGLLAAVLLSNTMHSKPVDQGEDLVDVPLDCGSGPITHRLGGNDWLVFSCSDGGSLIFLAVTPNPAAPFLFLAHAEGQRYKVSGEGKGKKSTAKAALDELQAMTAEDFRELLETTKQHD